MLGPVDYLVWFAGPAAQAAVVVCLLRKREFLRYISLSIYVLGTTLVTTIDFFLLRRFGVQSLEYTYFYYYSESLLTILLFLVIMQFYEQVFAELRAAIYIRRSAVALLVATAAFSYLVVHANKDHLTSRFVVALGQNLYFIGVVLTYILWGAVLKLRETRTRLIQLVLALGVYFSATAAAYSLRNLFPGLQGSFLHWIPPLAGLWLPLAWAFTFVKVPETARLATAQLMARAR
jgi:hypothetical protein